MQVTPYKTAKIRVEDDLTRILDADLPPLREGDIVAITSKIVSLCQGDVVKDDGGVDKRALIRGEAQYYLDPSASPHSIVITITQGILIATAGIDESNGDGYYILWPRDVQEAAVAVWRHLRRRHGVSRLGVIITDSRTTPLRRGVTGVGLAWCGFAAHKDYVGTPDLFGRRMRATTTNILDALAAAAVLVMGEGDEQTPLALIREASPVSFQTRPPSIEEVRAVHIELHDDLYAPLLTSVSWKNG